MKGCKSKKVPGRKATESQEKHPDNGTPWSAKEQSQYRAGVGKLQYIINEHPEIVYGVKHCSTRLANPTQADMVHLRSCMRLMAGVKTE